VARHSASVLEYCAHTIQRNQPNGHYVAVFDLKVQARPHTQKESKNTQDVHGLLQKGATAEKKGASTPFLRD
jgi:hypothetical protein